MQHVSETSIRGAEPLSRVLFAETNGRLRRFLERGFPQIAGGRRHAFLEQILAMRASGKPAQQHKAVLVASVAHAMGRGDRAIPDIESALAGSPDNPTLLIWLYRCIGQRFEQDEIDIHFSHEAHTPRQILERIVSLPAICRSEALSAALKGINSSTGFDVIERGVGSLEDEKAGWIQVVDTLSPRLTTLSGSIQHGLANKTDEIIAEGQRLAASSYAHLIRASSDYESLTRLAGWANAGLAAHPDNPTLLEWQKRLQAD